MSGFNSENVGLYVHVPFCRTKCRYCAFYSEPIADYDADAVVDAMITELQRYELVESIKTIYLGGGSPSSLPHKLLLRLTKKLMFLCPEAEEFTIEVNPGQVDKTLLNKLRKAGVNRLSIGAQSFIQKELDFLGRRHTVDSIRNSVLQGKSAGFDNISLDLIFAIPGSNLKSWKQNLHSAVKMEIEHISAYALTYENCTPLGRAHATGEIQTIDEDTDRAMYELTVEELENAGMHQYEISNFTRDGFQCRHNLNYWANGSYIGIGPGATSYLHSQRSTNYPDINKYTEAVKSNQSTIAECETLNDIERACETAVLNLRRRYGIDLAEFKTLTDFDAEELFESPIRMNKEQGLINTSDGRIFLSRGALAIADSVLCDFAAV